MVQGTTPTLLFKFSVDLNLINDWRICFSQQGKENLIKTAKDCITDENQVIYLKLTQEETFDFDNGEYLRIKVKALTKDNNVIPSQTIALTVCEMLDKVPFDIENTLPTPIDTSIINFEFDTEPCGFGLDIENFYVECVGGGSGGDIVVDKELSETSTNPVQNKVVTKAISQLEQGKQDKLEFTDVVSGSVDRNLIPIVGAVNDAFNTLVSEVLPELYATKDEFLAVDEHISNYESKVDENIERINELYGKFGGLDEQLDNFVTKEEIENLPSGGANVIISNTEPADAPVGTLWFDTSETTISYAEGVGF